MLRRAQLVYLAGESCAGFRRRKLTTGVTILIMSAALLILALTTVVTLNLGRFLEQAKSGIDVRVFLVEGDEDPALLQPRLLALPGVADVAFVTADQALAEFSARLGEDADVLYLLDDNPLPESFLLTLTAEARNLDTVEALAAEIRTLPGVAEIVYHHDWITTLQRWTFRFQLASLIVCLLVFLAAVFVISNTVKLTMAASARSIEIQKLVGATNSFIRTPYLLEGMIHGLLAGVLAMGLLFVGSRALGERIDGLVFFSDLQMAGFVLFCIVLGLLGSFAAMRKYLLLEGTL